MYKLRIIKKIHELILVYIYFFLPLKKRTAYLLNLQKFLK